MRVPRRGRYLLAHPVHTHILGTCVGMNEDSEAWAGVPSASPLSRIRDTVLYCGSATCARAPKSEKEKGVVLVAAEAWHYHPWKLAHQVSCCSSHLRGAFSSSAGRTQLQEMVARSHASLLLITKQGSSWPLALLHCPQKGCASGEGLCRRGLRGPWPPGLSSSQSLQHSASGSHLQEPGPGLDEHPYKNNFEPVPKVGAGS